MSDNTQTDLFRKELLVILEETFTHVHGIYLDGGTSLFETLAKLSAEDASIRTADEGATLAAQVEHVRFYLDVLDDVMRTHQPARVDWRDIWTRVSTVSSEEWESSMRRLRESYERVVQTITTYDDWHDDYGFGGALAVLTHTAYHLGGIRQGVRHVAALKRMSREEPAK
jgi:hypothetical protein